MQFNIQFCPPDDEHMCSKHVEAWNKLITKFSASSWLILRNKYIEMHGQQNIKIYYQSLWALHDTVSRHFSQILKLQTRWSSCNFCTAQCVLPRAIHSAFICWPFAGLYWNVLCVFVTCWTHKKRTRCPTLGPHCLGSLCQTSAAQSFPSIWPLLSPLTLLTRLVM